MIEEYVHFTSDGMELEGILSYDENVQSPSMMLLCPPHPQLGGDMENNVIMTLGQVLAENGFAALRFNYRGVGKSGSKFDNIADIYEYWEGVLNNDNYHDAIADAASALEYLESAVGTNRMFITGYSFGAIVAMMLSADNEKVGAFASISAPFGRFDSSLLSNCRKPKLFICADNDLAASNEELEMGILKISEPKTLDVIQDCDHFYRGREIEIANKVLEFYR